VNVLVDGSVTDFLDVRVIVRTRPTLPKRVVTDAAGEFRKALSGGSLHLILGWLSHHVRDTNFIAAVPDEIGGGSVAGLHRMAS
jgi:hypothetical protein